MVRTLRVGAGGRWPVYNERINPLVVKQQSDVSCGEIKAQVLSIKAREGFNIFDVEMLVGANIYTSQVTVDVFKLGDDYVQHASSERDLWDILQHNARAVGKIYKLVFKVYNGEEAELPVIISEHLPINPIFARQLAFAN